MITEQFLNSCYSIMLGSSKVKKDKSLYRDILEILEFYKKKESIDIPINIKNKYDCLKKICELKLDGKENGSILDSLFSGGKFNNEEIVNFINQKSGQELSDEEVSDIVNQIRLRRKLNILFRNYDQINNLVDLIKDGNFESSDDLVSVYENTVKDMYISLSECNKSIEIEASSSLDLKNDDYSSVIETIKKKYSNIVKTPTGYKVFDDEVLNGGFEPSRVYVFAGAPGGGKSTFLNNIIVNSALSSANEYQKLDLNNSSNTVYNIDKEKIYLYITLENSLDESLLRTYQPLFNRTTTQTINDINSEVDIKSSIINEFSKNNTNVIMKYFSGKSISSIDIRMILDSILDKYPNSIIAGVFIDYLDLLLPSIKYELYRLELGQVILDCKSLAVDYNLPVIIPTQLGRSSYRVEDSSQLNLDMVGESVKKVEGADVVCMQIRDPIKDDIVHFKVGKNRAGRANVNFGFKVNWPTYKFISCYLNNNKKSYDIEKENSYGFQVTNSNQQF